MWSFQIPNVVCMVSDKTWGIPVGMQWPTTGGGWRKTYTGSFKTRSTTTTDTRASRNCISRIFSLSLSTKFDTITKPTPPRLGHQPVDQKRNDTGSEAGSLTVLIPLLYANFVVPLDTTVEHVRKLNN